MDIRLAASGDTGGIAEIYRPIVECTPTSFELEPPDDREIRQRVDATLPTLPWLVCEHQSCIAGYAYASPHRARAAYQWSVDTSVYVHSAYRRCGVARGLYASLFKILAAQGYFNACAGITLPNHGSVGLHESVGFQPVGIYRKVGHKLGNWHDVGWWQLALRQPVEIPQPTVKLDQLRNNDASWQRMLTAGLVHIRSRSLTA